MFGGMNPLLAALLGGQGGFGSGADPSGGMSASGGIGMGMGTGDDYEGVPSAGTPPDAMPNQQQSENIEVEGWRPKKRSFLGFLGDALIMSQGGSAVFANRTKNRNIQEAMEGFTTDPLQAIQRMRQIDPDTAWKMYGQYADDRRADGIAQIRKDAAKDIARNRLGAMMGAARPETYATSYDMMRRYAEARELDPDEIPREYNEDKIRTYRMGGLNVDDQEDNARADAQQAARLDDYDRDAEDRNARYAEGQDRIDARTTYTQDRQDRRQSMKPASKGASGKGEPGLQETDVVRPGENLQVMREGGRIVAARVTRKDQYGRPSQVLLSPAALEQLKQKYK